MIPLERWRQRVAGESASRHAGGDHPVRGGCAIVLAGGLRPSRLIEHTGIATLDLDLGPGVRVLDHWVELLHDALGEDAPILVVPSRSCPLPDLSDTSARLVDEAGDYRGPAGVIRDVASQAGGDGPVMVVEAARGVLGSLRGLVRSHVAHGALATVGRNPDSSPAGVYLLERSAIDMVPRRGFMDLKEQLLPRVREVGSVRVFDLKAPGALPLRTRRQFLDAVSWLSRGHGGESATSIWWTPSSGTWRVIGERAHIDDGAQVVDSVVMRDARIGARSLVARSIVCPGSVVPAGTRVVDSVVGRSGVSLDRPAPRMHRSRRVVA